jgi:peptide chain release factor 1
MKDTMKNKLERLILKYDELNNKLSSEGITNDLNLFKKISKEHSDLGPVIETYSEYKNTTKNIEEAKELLNDPEMKEFAQDEIDQGRIKIEEIESNLQKLLIPKDPNDDKNIFLEIRAGAGGDESALFAGDLF